MRRDKTFAQILLIFSIAHVVLGAPALVRQRSIEPDVPDNGPTDGSMPGPSLVTAPDVSEAPPPPGSEQDSAPGPSAGSSHQGGVQPAAPPTPPDGLHQDSTASHASLSDMSVSQDSTSSHDAEIAPWSGRPQLHYVSSSYFSPPASLNPPSQRPGSWAPPVHDDDNSLAGSGAQRKYWFVPLGDSPPRPPSGSGAHSSYYNDPPPPASKAAQLYNSPPPPASEAAQLHNSPPPPASEAAQLHNSPPPTSGVAQLHDELPSGPVDAPLPDAPPSMPWWHTLGHASEIEQAPSTVSSLRLEPEALEAPRVSTASLGSGWAEAFAVAAEAEAKEVAAQAAKKAKPPKGLCGLRCWMQFYPRSFFKSSPERDHGHHLS